MNYTRRQLKTLKAYLNRVATEGVLKFGKEEHTNALESLFSTMSLIHESAYESETFKKLLNEKAGPENSDTWVIYQILFGKDDTNLPLYIDHILHPVLAWRLENTTIEL